MDGQNVTRSFMFKLTIEIHKLPTSYKPVFKTKPAFYITIEDIDGAIYLLRRDGTIASHMSGKPGKYLYFSSHASARRMKYVFENGAFWLYQLKNKTELKSLERCIRIARLAVPGQLSKLIGEK